MERGCSGRYLTISTVDEAVEAFIPFDLPPASELLVTPELQTLLDRCLVALGRLDSFSTLLPDTTLFLFMHIRKEALLSSLIEGTQSSISELLLYELDENENYQPKDAEEVSSYVKALDLGLKRLAEGAPLSMRLIKELHSVLLASGRGSEYLPGEVRRSQNWIGGSRPGNALFVPPPPEELPELLSALEKYWNDLPQRTPILVKAALSHIQFETIHPFLDGNGRLGRLLITLMLCSEGVLKEPMLYLSLYLKSHRSEYYAHLTHVRKSGDWESWLEFFAKGILATAEQASLTAMELLALAERDRQAIHSLGRPATSALGVHRVMLRRPIIDANTLHTETGISIATINKSLQHLVDLGIVEEITARKRNRIFSYTEYLEIISVGTEPLD